MTNTQMDTRLTNTRMTDTLMTNTPSFNAPNLVQTFEYFSEIQQFKVEGNQFIQEKLNIISEERKNFQDFAEQSITHSLVMRNHASDLITFAECCEDDSISDIELLDLLRACLDQAKLNKEKSVSLKDQLVRIKTSLGIVVKEIVEQNDNIMEEQENLSKKISQANKVKEGAISVSKRSVMAAGLGTFAAVAAAPFTGGASLIAEILVALGAATVVGSAATATVSTTVAGVSSFRSTVLNSNYKLKNTLPEMKNCLGNIDMTISQYESYWESQIVEIDDIINKLKRNKDGRRMVKTIARTISDKAKTIHRDSNDYSVVMRDAVNADRFGRNLRN
ncbi:3395_t:CDS:2 [Funneliformis mosseae]|uniref:3395_t:CDS:1 n=1 Tax=Funneliformis mosseae TaxID=27381 RepID=A0A9N8V7P8_FUNMO|nr:3395_t:CDS:2 [Funneliformis mosseae]